MKLYEINAIFREGKDGRVYGLTLVDNRKCTVFNGSDLGKGYSGQALMKRFSEKTNFLEIVEREGSGLDRTAKVAAQLQPQDITQHDQIQDIGKQFLNVMKPEKLHQEPIDHNLKMNKRKRKRRIRF